MTTPNIPRVTEYLRAHPNGVHGWQISGHLDTTDDSAYQSLLLMQSRGKVVLVSRGKTNADSVWALPVKTATPPIFRARETLEAFQVAAMGKQIERVAEVA